MTWSIRQRRITSHSDRPITDDGAERDRRDRLISACDIHLRALDRHAKWEIEFAGAGDLESALDAGLDARALVAELRITDDESAP